jgi:uncharacterized protein
MLKIFTLAIALLIVPPVSASGQDWEKGLTAAQSGDFATALREWTPLAEQGDALAQYNLGLMYGKGLGVTQDPKAALLWYTLAAEQGHAKAQYNLGLKYALGQGVIQDNVYAHMWWNIAASSGQKDAVENRDIAAGLMTPADISKAQDLARECVAKDYKGC